MSNFLRMFRSKKAEKGNANIVDEDKLPYRNKEFYSRRDKQRQTKLRSVDDTFLKPTAAYHTVTQPRQYKVSRSCVGRDEYDKCRYSFDFATRANSKYNKRVHTGDRYHDRELALSKTPYDSELLDSDDSVDSRSRTGMQANNDEAFKMLESKMDALMYRLRKEEERKNAYKQKLMSERIVRQHVETKFVEDIQRLTRLVDTLKNEQKSYRNRISSLEMQLKNSNSQIHSEPFQNVSLFCSPPSTSNERTSMMGIADLVCSATSSSTVPLQNTLHCNSLNEDGVDEVKNFRVNEVSSSVEIGRSEGKCIRTESGSSFSVHENESTNLEETLLGQPAVPERHVFLEKTISAIRRSSSDTKLNRFHSLKATDM